MNKNMDKTIRKKIEKAAEILKNSGAKEIYIFGSAANDTMNSHSDIDLAVSGLPPRVFFEAMGKATDELEFPVDLVDLDEENRFVSYLKEKGKLYRVA